VRSRDCPVVQPRGPDAESSEFFLVCVGFSTLVSFLPGLELAEKDRPCRIEACSLNLWRLSYEVAHPYTLFSLKSDRFPVSYPCAYFKFLKTPRIPPDPPGRIFGNFAFSLDSHPAQLVGEERRL